MTAGQMVGVILLAAMTAAWALVLWPTEREGGWFGLLSSRPPRVRR